VSSRSGAETVGFRAGERASASFRWYRLNVSFIGFTRVVGRDGCAFRFHIVCLLFVLLVASNYGRHRFVAVALDLIDVVRG
jgi:hypothetical protein